MFNTNTTIPSPQQIYRHFKGSLYQIITTAEHTETGELLVIYQALYGDFRTYARPLTMFTGKVDKIKYPKATQEYRFELITPAGCARADAGAIPTEADGSPESASAPTEAARSPESASAPTEAAKSPESASTPTEAAHALESASALTEAARSPEPSANPASFEVCGAEESGLDEPNLDPLVLEFLDSDTYEQRLNILAALRHRITDDMITTMAIVCDIELSGDSLEERFEGLRNCLVTLQKYECSRLR